MFFHGFPGFAGAGDGGFPGAGARGGGRSKPVDTEAFYKLLEVEKSAQPHEIKKAYRKLAMRHHPDKGGDPEVFKKITRAYEVLSDEEKRQVYDQHGEEGLEHGGGGGDPTDIFDMVFGGGGRRGGGGSQKRRGKNVIHSMDLTLEQLYTGHTKKVAVNRTVVDENYGVKDCTTCDGRGQVTRVMRMGNMIQQMQSACSNCEGQGKIFKTKREKEILEVYVEKGAPNQHKVVFHNKADEKPGYEPGDVVFVVQEKEHSMFKRVNADLFMKKNITLLEALTGVNITIPQLDGRKLVVKYDGIISPRIEQEAEWQEFDGMDCPGDDMAKCASTEIQKLKEICIKKGFHGFIIDEKERCAYFRQLSREEHLSKKKSKKGFKLYVTPDPDVAANLRMRKAVKGEGMPMFKNSMMKGNLFIDFVIDFPKNLTSDVKLKLKDLLPGPDTMQLEDDPDFEEYFLEDMDPKASEEAAAYAYEDDDDEEGGAGRGPGEMQCQQQ